MRASCNQGGSFILQADVEGQVSCSVSARNGLSLRDVLSEKLELTGGRKWSNFEVYTKWTREHVEWEMNVSCVRGHALMVVNKLDPVPVALPGAHHFLHTDMIDAAAQSHTNKDFCYIIRPSARNPGFYTLAITTPTVPNGNSVLRHVKIGFDNQKESGKFTLCSKDFDDLDSLVAFFKGTPIKAHNGPNMYLRYPVPVDPTLAEDCKQRCRLTRSGERYDYESAKSDVDSIDNMSLRSYGTPSAISLSYDASNSDLSDDERGGHYQYPTGPVGQYPDTRYHGTSDGRSRNSTIISNTGDAAQSPCVMDRDAQSPFAIDYNQQNHPTIDSYDNDVVMRAQSTSSSGTTSSSRTTSSTNSSTGGSFTGHRTSSRRKVEEEEDAPMSPEAATSPRSAMANITNMFKRNSSKKSSLQRGRPQSEIIQQRHRVQVGSRCNSASPNVNSVQAQPDDDYMEMKPRIVVSPTSSLPDQLRSYSATPDQEEDPNSRTLTRLQFDFAEPEETYVTMTPNIVTSPSDHLSDVSCRSDPSETYVTMTPLNVVSPTDSMQANHVARRTPSQKRYDTHTYANTHKPALYQNLQLQQNQTESYYMNTRQGPDNTTANSRQGLDNTTTNSRQGLDNTTTYKLIANVTELMATVKQQSTDITTLKKTVNELRKKVQELQVQGEEFEYAIE